MYGVRDEEYYQAKTAALQLLQASKTPQNKIPSSFESLSSFEREIAQAAVRLHRSKKCFNLFIEERLKVYSIRKAEYKVKRESSILIIQFFWRTCLTKLKRMKMRIERVCSADIIRLSYLIYKNNKLQAERERVKREEREEKEKVEREERERKELERRVEELEEVLKRKDDELEWARRRAEERRLELNTDDSTTLKNLSNPLVDVTVHPHAPKTQQNLLSNKLEITDWSDPTFSSDPKTWGGFKGGFKGVVSVVRLERTAPKKPEKVWEPRVSKFMNTTSRSKSRGDEDSIETEQSGGASVMSSRSSRSHGWIKKSSVKAGGGRRSMSPQKRGQKVKYIPLPPIPSFDSERATPISYPPRSHKRNSSTSSIEKVSPALKRSPSDDQTVTSFASSPAHRSGWSLPPKPSKPPTSILKYNRKFVPKSGGSSLPPPSSGTIIKKQQRLCKVKDNSIPKRGEKIRGNFEDLGFEDLGTIRRRSYEDEEVEVKGKEGCVVS